MARPAFNRLSEIPRPVWVLGFVSLFMDVSSEMIHSLLPIYLVAVLGASAVEVGFIEGLAEGTAMITKVFSGALSDWLGRRKMLAIAGYGLSACVKPLFPLADSIGWVVFARFADRVGKGIRGAPRDALIADIAPAALRGASFGLRQTLDTIGAVAGPLAAIAIMAAFANQYTLVFWIAVVPALIAVFLLATGIKEPGDRIQKGRQLNWGDAARLPSAYWIALAAVTVLTLARFSEAFLLLRSQQAGLLPVTAPFVLVVMNVVYSLTSYPAGSLSDRVGRKTVLLAGVGVLALADAVLAAPPTLPTLFVGVALWGMHMGLTQGIFAAIVADAAPAHLRGTGFGLFNLVAGVAALAASVIAGALWQEFGAASAFLAGAALAAASLVALLVARQGS